MDDMQPPLSERPGAAEGRRVRDLVREVVAETAPEELPVVADMEQLDDAVIIRELTRPSKNEPLGFGFDEIANLLTAALWLILAATAEQSAEAAVKDGARRLRNRLRRHPKAEIATIPPLTREQLAELRETLRAECERRGMSDAETEPVVNAVITRLAVRDDPGGREPDPER